MHDINSHILFSINNIKKRIKVFIEYIIILYFDCKAKNDKKEFNSDYTLKLLFIDLLR